MPEEVEDEQDKFAEVLAKIGLDLPQEVPDPGRRVHTPPMYHPDPEEDELERRLAALRM